MARSNFHQLWDAAFPIDPEAPRRAREEALRARKTLGEWLEEAIEEKIEREQKKVKWKRLVPTGLSGVGNG